MEQILKQILNEITGLKEGQQRTENEIKGLKNDVGGLKNDVGGLKEGQQRLEEKIDIIDKKLNAVNNQTANLTEFRTEVNIKLDNLICYLPRIPFN